jgi:hypothetical protein
MHGQAMTERAAKKCIKHGFYVYFNVQVDFILSFYLIKDDLG